MARRNWIVSVTTDDEAPLIFGPYTERRSEELAEKFNAHDFGDDFGYINASAIPIQNPGIRGMLTEFGHCEGA